MSDLNTIDEEVNSPNWVDAISDFATLAPIMSNLFTGNPESV
nr:MAG TPA: hypothetical protein [Caudoviricetes sp.]